MTESDAIDDFLARPFLHVIEPDDGGGFTAWILEMPNVVSEGNTADEALLNLTDAFAGVLEVMLSEGRAVPEPYSERDYSGRLQLRIPPTLHRRVVIRAEAEHVSINRVLSDAVARHVGSDSRVAAARPARRRRNAAG